MQLKVNRGFSWAWLQATLFALLLTAQAASHADQKYINVWKTGMSVITEPASAGYIYIRDAQKGYYHMERATLEHGAYQSNWQSAEWKVEAGSDYVRFQNRWKPTVYLHVETGSVGAGPVPDGYLSARWKDGGVAMKDVGLKLRAKFQCSDPGDDGCSHPGSDPVSEQLKAVFKPACQVHDRCYSSPWRLSGKPGTHGHKVCDEEFNENMSSICKGLNNASQFDCWVGRTTFAAVVHDWGHKAYDNGQAKAERICSDKSSRIDNGAVRFFNSGGYVAKVEMVYTLNGQATKKEENLAINEVAEWVIPVGSTAIVVSAYSFTGLVWDPRKLIFMEAWAKPQSKCFKVYNTTLDPKFNNICDPFDR